MCSAVSLNKSFCLASKKSQGLQSFVCAYTNTPNSYWANIENFSIDLYFIRSKLRSIFCWWTKRNGTPDFFFLNLLQLFPSIWIRLKSIFFLILLPSLSSVIMRLNSIFRASIFFIKCNKMSCKPLAVDGQYSEIWFENNWTWHSKLIHMWLAIIHNCCRCCRWKIQTEWCREHDSNEQKNGFTNICCLAAVVVVIHFFLVSAQNYGVMSIVQWSITMRNGFVVTSSFVIGIALEWTIWTRIETCNSICFWLLV